MTTGVADPIFLDTNILVHASAAGSPLHQTALQAVQGLSSAGTEVWISRQVIREYLATLTRPQRFSSPQPIATLIADVQYHQRLFRIAEDGPDVTARLLVLIQRIATGGKQIHDANIVATMLVHGVPRLLTHNVADFTRFGGLITVVPLLTRS
jgi:predicted nucleic acid-binding protein